MSLKRIFSPTIANYLFQNGATLKTISVDREKQGSTIFFFEKNDKLNELLANR